MKSLPFNLFLSGIALLVTVSSTIAADITWDTSATAGIQGGGGNWDSTATTNWTTNGGTTRNFWNNTTNAADTAIFTTASATVNIGAAGVSSETLNLIGMRFTVATYTVGSGVNDGVLAFDTQLGSIDTSALASGALTTINSKLTGTGGLTIAANGSLSAAGGNGGRLALSGDNSGLSGGIAITSGLVGVVNANSLGANQITLTNGAGLVNANIAFLSYSNNIVLGSGGGTIRNWGTFGTNLTGSFTGTGNLNITDAGLLALGSHTGSGGSAVNTSTSSFTGKVAVAGGGKLGISGDSALGSTPATFTADSITLAGGSRLMNMTGITTLTNYTAGFTINLHANRGITLGTGGGEIMVGYNKTFTVNGVITGNGNLTKSDIGTLTLTAANTYTGNTVVNAGTLSLPANAQLSFVIGATSGTNNRISGAGNATLNGDFNIDTTLADASALTTGSWTLENVTPLTGAYGASFRVYSGLSLWSVTGDVWTKTVGSKLYSFNETTGILTLSTTGGFESWIAGKGLAGADAAFDADPDNDGIGNGLEFALGGEPNPANPASNSTSLLPAVSESSGDMSFTFRRKDFSETGVALTFQWSTDLTFPSPANDIPLGAVDSSADTILVDVTEDSPDDDTDTIVITVPAAKAVAGKIFGRLKAVKLP